MQTLGKLDCLPECCSTGGATQSQGTAAQSKALLPCQAPSVSLPPACMTQKAADRHGHTAGPHSAAKSAQQAAPCGRQTSLWSSNTAGRGSHLGPDLLQVSAQGLQNAGGHTLILAQQAQQNVLSADVVVPCRAAKGYGG